MRDRLEQASQDAQLAFWASVAKSFPEIKTGDLEPAIVFDFDIMCAKAVRAWVWSNDPDLLVSETIGG